MGTAGTSQGSSESTVSSDSLESVGAIIVALGLLMIVFAGAYGLAAGPLVVALGAVVWKMGEMRKELKGELGRLRAELEFLKSISGVENG